MKKILLFFLGLVCFTTVNAEDIGLRDSVSVIMHSQRAYILYQIEKGETASQIARRYGYTLTDIRNANPGTDLSKLSPGDQIYIPFPHTSPTTNTKPKIKETIIEAYVIEEGDSWYKIAGKFNTKVEDLKVLNKKADNNLMPGTTILIEKDLSPKNVAKNERPLSYNAYLPAIAKGTHRIVQLHKIKKDQTLYKLSEKYKVNIKEIFKLNNLTRDSKLAIDQKIVIGYQDNKLENSSDIKVSERILNDDKQAVSTFDAENIPNHEGDSTVVVNNSFQPVIHVGTAIVASSESPKHVALYDHAPEGTTIIIKNQANDKITSAKVIGPLSDIDRKNKVLITLSKGCMKALKNKKDRFQVEVKHLKKK